MTKTYDTDVRWPRLLVAARVWRATRVGQRVPAGTPVAHLMDAIAAFDDDDDEVPE